MTKRLRITVLALAVALGLAVVLWRADWFDSDEPIGMTQAPCAPEGVPVTRKREDDWAGLCHYQAHNARIAAEAEQPQAVLIGDSITQAWPGLETHGNAGAPVNRGIAGQTSAQVLLRFQQDAIALRPKAIHILVGTNDVAGVTGPNSPAMYQANIRAMVDMARAKGIPVILGTIPPAESYPWEPGLSPGNWVQVLNRWIRDFASERGLILADYYSVLSTQDGGIDPELYGDGVHPNLQGYAAMQAVLDEALASPEIGAAASR
ncbi:MAG: GDSL-type esterase/lipase family protein [Novosphingobium sp.]|nr:GDSL family lipase [Novosphingobium sp.]